MVSKFSSNGILLRGCNVSFIALVPKVEVSQSLGEFHPISLVGCMYWQNYLPIDLRE